MDPDNLAGDRRLALAASAAWLQPVVDDSRCMCVPWLCMTTSAVEPLPCKSWMAILKTLNLIVRKWEGTVPKPEYCLALKERLVRKTWGSGSASAPHPAALHQGAATCQTFRMGRVQEMVKVVMSRSRACAFVVAHVSSRQHLLW